MSDSHSSRRDFLRGKAAAKAVSTWMSPKEGDEESPTERRAAKLLVQFSRNAMATEFQAILDAQKHPLGPDAAMDALDIIEALEGQLSVYRPQSEVSQLNDRFKDDATAPLSVEHGLYELLETSVRLWDETSGAFDITAAPLSRVWGFHRRRGAWPDEKDLQDALRLVGSEAIRLDPHEKSVTCANVGCEINLGAIGKGWALDQAAQHIEFEGVYDFLLHGGTSSVLARGSRHGRQGWEIGLMHPLIPQQRIGVLVVQDAAIGTSGCGNQFFHHNGRRLSHILDPRTGHPAEGVLSATVLAPTAAEADALATAVYVMGFDQTQELIARRDDLGVILVTTGARSGAVEIRTLNLPEGCWTPVEPTFEVAFRKPDA